MTSTTLYIERDGRELALTATGQVEHTCPPSVQYLGVEPEIALTEDERDRAEQAVIDAWGEDDSADCAAEDRADWERDARRVEG